ncbi:ras guanine nucleotide exchange factor domain-containing protein [Globomyces pollinis-pini]|nr:ras guanine nucleotide exchange factor domain-containing protein [Globomyces pollinis-pini]
MIHRNPTLVSCVCVDFNFNSNSLNILVKDGSLYFKLENITNYSLAIHHPDAIYIKYKDLAIPTTYKIITNRARDIYTLLLASPLPTRKVSKKLSRKLSRKSSTKQIHDIKNQKSSEEDLEFPSHDLAFHTLPSAPVQSNTPDFNLVPVERSNSFTHSPMHSTMPPKLTKRVSRFFKKLIKPKSNNDLKNVDNSDSTKKVPVQEDQNLNGSQTLQRGRFGIVHHEMSTNDTLHKKFNKLNLEYESIKFDDTSAHVHFRESFDQNASNVSFIHENHSSEFGLDVTSNEMDAADTYSLPDDSQYQRDSDNLDSSDSLGKTSDKSSQIQTGKDINGRNNDTLAINVVSEMGTSPSNSIAKHKSVHSLLITKSNSQSDASVSSVDHHELIRNFNANPTSTLISPSMSRGLSKSDCSMYCSEGSDDYEEVPRQQPGHLPPRSTNILRYNNQNELILITLPNDEAYPVAGTLDSLLNLIVSNPLSRFCDVFVLTMHDIAEPLTIIKALNSILDGLIIEYEHRPESKVQIHRLFTFIKKMLALFPDLCQCTNIHETLYSMIKSAESILHADYVNSFLQLTMYNQLYSIVLPRGSFQIDLLKFTALEIATQMTLIDFGLFFAIKPNEFTLFFDNSFQDHTFKGIHDFIARTNRISRWTASLICSATSLPIRTSIMALLIEVAKECLKLKNFNTSMAIITGLCNPNVMRLKNTFAQLSTETRNQLESLELVFSPNNNFKNIRIIQKNTTTVHIPLILLITKDIHFIKQFHPNTKTYENMCLIEVKRRGQLYNIIEPVIRMKSMRYSVEPGFYCPITATDPTPLALLLCRLMKLDKSCLERQSMLLEP